MAVDGLTTNSCCEPLVVQAILNRYQALLEIACPLRFVMDGLVGYIQLHRDQATVGFANVSACRLSGGNPPDGSPDNTSGHEPYRPWESMSMGSTMTFDSKPSLLYQGLVVRNS